VLNPDTESHHGIIVDENPKHSFLGDKCSAKGQTPTVGRSRGRPRRQIPTVETHMKIEPKRKLRSHINAEAGAEDPWVMLSKAPSITPFSPKKANKARPPRQKPVNDPFVFPHESLFLTIF
jgi:hypothetical protein